MRLPIDDVLPRIVAALRGGGAAVVEAPPGAGKTTRVPPALLDAVPGRIVMLEPRRIAARAAAERIAHEMGEAPGGTVGFRMRGATVPGARIEVVTEGILTRMIQSDPSLPGVGAVIFDEIHERSLNGDLGLALVLEARAALRPDLALAAMSATLDAAWVADLMGGAPVITAQGRAYPVDIRHAARAPADWLAGMADAVIEGLSLPGDILAFCPGEGEIGRLAARLEGRVGDAAIHRLFGAAKPEAQRAAIASGGGRKVVLATSIAETSLTIPGVRVVVDGGLARRSRHDPGTGMSALVTEPASRAECDQRAGRAGRTAPGVCLRIWPRGAHGARPAHAPAEIETADLAALALELAAWGSDDVPLPTPPPPGPLAEARALLRGLGAMDGTGITAHGRALARLPLHPRLGHMLTVAGAEAAGLAALLSDRDPLRDAGSDVALRLRALRDGDPAARPGALARLRAEAKRLARRAGPDAGLSVGQWAALAFPDRIGMRRPGDAPRYVLSGGRGASLRDDDPLGAAPFLVACDAGGDGPDARVRLAAAITRAELLEVAGARVEELQVCDWSRRARAVRARIQRRLGALVLDDRIWRDAPEGALAAAMCAGIRDLGLSLPAPARRLQARAALARAAGAGVPDLSDEALTEGLEGWLAPHLYGVRDEAAWRRFDPLPALKLHLGWDGERAVEAAAPGHLVTPLGHRVPIDYGPEHPTVALRLQELFGQTAHPTVAGRPLRLELLSPARRPVQVTMDLPGFWAGSYAEVRKEMRARYPRHPWPEDPTVADPTLRAKRRGT
ncbi:MAG: ATP-dependent helicase HrpB [Paracoccaceae bacterium]